MSQDSIEAILGISQTKLGFFQEWQRNLHELQDAHAQSEQRRLSLAAILEGITDLMMVLDEDLRILSVNRVFEELFPGRPYAGEHCYTLFRRGDRPCATCPAFLSLRHGTVNRASDIFHIGEEPLHFDMVASPLPHPSGSGQSVLMLKRDVTREKQLQAQIYQSEKMASIGTLAAGVAHEINNPLTAIAGFAEGLKRRLPMIRGGLPGEVADDFEEYTNTILRECGRCRDIVEALMCFSRPLRTAAPVDLRALIEETLPLFQHALKRHSRVLICLDLDPDLPTVWGHGTQLRQIVLNLFTNALDALQPGKERPDDAADAAGGADAADGADAPYAADGAETGADAQAGHPRSATRAEAGADDSITVRTYQQDGQVVLEVEDTGPNFDPRRLRAAFEPFYTTKPQGLGLGLSMCYTVVRAHGGDISLTRSADGKTRATVRLPTRPAGPGELS